MDKPKPSGLPRPSRLPRPSASRENLQQAARTQNSIFNPRLRNSPSREQLNTSTPQRPRPIPNTVRLTSRPIQRKISNNSFRKPQVSEQDSVRPTSSEEDDVVGEYRSTSVISDEDELGEPLSPRGLSLSERTMETLKKIPPSPAVRRRQSSFYNSESSQRPASRANSFSRPGSSYNSDGSMRPPSRRSASSRPTSSAESGLSVTDFRASSGTFHPPITSYTATTPMKRPSPAKTLKTPTIRTSFSADMTQLPSPSNALQRSPSPVKSERLPTIKSGSKTYSARSVKERASVTGLFRKPSMPSMDQTTGEDNNVAVVTKKRSMNFKSIPQKSVTSAPIEPAVSHMNRGDTAAAKSSSALRDQIAKAKAAKRAASNPVLMKPALGSAIDFPAEIPVIPTSSFDFGLSNDPFNQRADPNSSKAILRQRISAARADGRLNIAAMGFKDMPEEVLNMYNLESIEPQDGSWAESVDLRKFIAADNEFEVLGDAVFPDVDAREAMEDDDFQGNQFGGVETLDLHGNILKSIPLGLRRLELLTSLNLSNNKLGNECLQVITQISSLRDLKLAGNGLSGTLQADIGNLSHLEVLDIQRNALENLPEELANLARLRVLNLSENKFRSLPFDIFSRLPLIELMAVKNGLAGTLIIADVAELQQLQVLHVAGNAITSITDAQLSLPSLHQLDCSSNRIHQLPDMSSWVSLRTLAAEDNSISSLPLGFIDLPKIKNVNLCGNDIKVLDDMIGKMESLDIFRISGNPLREKKFSTMSTEDLKNVLRARIAPSELEVAGFLTEPTTPSRPTSSHWPVQIEGILDRSNTNSHSLNPVAAADVAANNSIKVFHLHHNQFKEIPSSIAFFAATLTTLDLAHNELTSDTFLTDHLDLPALKELNLSSNTFSSLQPLMRHLQAPQLEKLDISFNRLTSLPALRPHFPSLIFLMASNNTIRDLLPEAVKGLKELDCSSNEINSLNARIGLLGGPNGLQRLNVSANRFRVPKYTILDKGTEATLAWLRDRIPAGEMPADESAADETTLADVD